MADYRVVQESSKTGYRYSLQEDGVGLVQLYSEIPLGLDTPVAIQWNGSAHSSYFIEVFDLLRLRQFYEQKLRWSSVAIRAMTPEHASVPSQLYRDEITLRDQRTPFSVPASCDYVRLDFRGGITVDDAGAASVVGVIERDADITMWGSVYAGPRPPNAKDDELGVYCPAFVLDMMSSDVAKFMYDTQYASRSVGSYASALTELLRVTQP